MVSQQESYNKWPYDPMDDLIIDLETIIALASMANIVDLDTYESYPGDEKICSNFDNEC